MKKILLIFGTRPEAIKMVPVIKELRRSELEPVVISTGQHDEMLFQVLDFVQDQAGLQSGGYEKPSRPIRVNRVNAAKIEADF